MSYQYVAARCRRPVGVEVQGAIVEVQAAFGNIARRRGVNFCGNLRAQADEPIDVLWRLERHRADEFLMERRPFHSLDVIEPIVYVVLDAGGFLYRRACALDNASVDGCCAPGHCIGVEHEHRGSVVEGLDGRCSACAAESGHYYVVLLIPDEVIGTR